MNQDKYTIKTQEAIQKALQIAEENKNPTIETAHILKSIIEVEPQLIKFLFEKSGVNFDVITSPLRALIDHFPKVSGQGQVYLSRDSQKMLQNAEKIAAKNKDQFITLEHMLLALVSAKDETSQILKDAGLKYDHLEKAIIQLRKGEKANTATERKALTAYHYSENTHTS